ncbi:MAG TPA: CBS domain-containing protein [Patescibacteria group bacterium]
MPEVTAEQFLDTFNKLEKHLNQLVGATEYYGFRRLVNQLSKRNGIVELHKQDLIEYSELRNAIVHKSTGEVIAEPHAETVTHLQAIYDKLVDPPSVMSIAATPVYTCDTKDMVDQLVRTMKQKFYAYVPVMHDGRFVGVFSENTLTKWLADVTPGANLRLADVTVGELQEYFDGPDDKANAYTFVAQAADVYHVQQQFLSFMSEKKRLGAIFITAHGRREEPILGIVTAWDVSKIGTRADASLTT